MNGPYCTSCGTPVPGVRFCTSCGAQVVARAPDPYEYLFADSDGAGSGGPAPAQGERSAADDFPTLEGTAIRPGRPPAPPTGPPPFMTAHQGAGAPQSAAGPDRRRAFGWPWVVAAAVVLAAVVGLGFSLTSARQGTDGTTSRVAASPSGSVPSARSSAPGDASTGASAGPHAPARVAARVSGLLAEEVAAHRSDSAAVGAMRSCRDVSRNRRMIASFAATRQRLGHRLAAVPASSDRQLDAVVHRLLATWRSLAPVDRSYIRWAQAVRRTHRACHAGPAPSTSPALQVQRQRLRAAWVAVLHAHPAWGVRPVAALQRGGLSFLLL